MLVLDEGYWTGTSCFERGGWNILIAIALLILLVALGVIRARIQHGPITQDIPIPSSNKLALYSILGFGLIALLVLSTAVAMARTSTLLFVEDGFLVERGCSRLAAYEDRFPLENVQMSYKYKSKKDDDKHHLIVFRPSPTDRTLTVEIKNTLYPVNLAKIAPDALRAYVQNARELKHAIPAAFRNL